MIRVADYIAQTLVAHQIRHVFLVTGGGAMHLNDAIGRCDGLEYIACHHEQACSMAADAYGRLAPQMAAVNVTTGPGGINAFNGVFGAYTDSVPMIVVSGQVKRETCLGAYELPELRQLGDQEADIMAMIGPITKYAQLILEAQTIRYHLEKALFLAQNARPGPVWLDVPVDVQGAMIEPDELAGFDAESEGFDNDFKPLHDEVEAALKKLAEAQRPVILAGYGIRAAHAQEELLEFAEKWKIPIAVAWTGCDVVPNSHPHFVGRPGTVGERAGNFALQNADVVLILGCRCNIRQISYAWEHFARKAFKIWVDADINELKKPTVKPDFGIVADLKAFLTAALRENKSPKTHEDYLSWCRERVERFSVVNDEQRTRENLVSGYHFIETLSEQLGEDDCIVTANGAASVMLVQAVKIKAGQRLIANSGSASMGFDLPASVGACFARDKKRVVCLAGDGSIMMNLQELQTISHHKLPIKIFVWNNDLYLSIRTTQNSFFGGNLVGESPISGVSAPDFQKLGPAFGLETRRIENNQDLGEKIREVLEFDGPVLCEIMMPSDELMLPKTSSLRLPDGRMVSKPLEDMFPFLEREEFRENMIIEPLAE